jgi:hypothetical protein
MKASEALCRYSSPSTLSEGFLRSRTLNDRESKLRAFTKSRMSTRVLRRRNWVFSLKSSFRASLCFSVGNMVFISLFDMFVYDFVGNFKASKGPALPCQTRTPCLTHTLPTCTHTTRFFLKICGSQVQKIQPAGLRGGGKKAENCPAPCPPLTLRHNF